MNGLRNQQTSKTSGFLRANSFSIVIAILWLTPLVIAGARGNPQDGTITAERMDAHTVLFTYQGRQYMGFDLERSKELKKAENDAVSFSQQLTLCKANVQDERVKYSQLQTLYGEQSTVLKSCMALTKNGSVLSNKWLNFGLDIAPTVTALVRPCR